MFFRGHWCFHVKECILLHGMPQALLCYIICKAILWSVLWSWLNPWNDNRVAEQACCNKLSLPHSGEAFHHYVFYCSKDNRSDYAYWQKKMKSVTSDVFFEWFRGGFLFSAVCSRRKRKIKASQKKHWQPSSVRST